MVNLLSMQSYSGDFKPAKALANVASKIDGSKTGLDAYFRNLRDLATTSVMIIIGISSAKVASQGNKK